MGKLIAVVVFLALAGCSRKDAGDKMCFLVAL